VKKYLFVV